MSERYGRNVELAPGLRVREVAVREDVPLIAQLLNLFSAAQKLADIFMGRNIHLGCSVPETHGDKLTVGQI